MFAFQLVVGGQTVGDNEAFILGSLMSELQHRPSFRARQLPDVRSSPAAAVELLLADEQFESAMLRGAESLNRWLVWLYDQQAHGVALAQAVQENKRIGPMLNLGGGPTEETNVTSPVPKAQETSEVAWTPARLIRVLTPYGGKLWPTAPSRYGGPSRGSGGRPPGKHCAEPRRRWPKAIKHKTPLAWP
jgi:hypothetical protein